MDNDTFLAWAVIFATFAGPIFAVFVTRWVDDRRGRTARKLDLFRTLLRSRRSKLSPEYVAALNLVEIDYHKSKKVLAIHAELMRHLSTMSTGKDWLDRSQRLDIRLLNAMGQDVGYDFDQLDLLEGGYMPQGLVDEEQEQVRLRKALITLLEGNRSLPIVIGQGVAAPGFPNAQTVRLHDVPPPA